MKKNETKQLKCYLSGPITGKDPAWCEQVFSQAEKEVIKQGYLPVNPLKNGLPFEAPRVHHLRTDLHLLIDCDAVYFIPGWEQSAGCCIEFNVAAPLGLLMLYGHQELNQ